MTDAVPLRPPEQVMSMRRAAGAVANTLSFSRSTMRELARGRWRIEKDRFDLDEEGRGEILYRLVSGTWTFHFFLVSLKLDEAQKMDRNWAQAWDAMGVLCEGEWTQEREGLLRREVPKQRSGFAEYGTLVYARGNRSGRLFDEVVDALASGRQPDARMIAKVGYILRTTAFIANGQLGTRGYAGFSLDHPFRRPYHAQMASAFVLREYMFDLVDHIARCRSPRAVRLDVRYRRYLGLGNAAATGLVPFLANHPQMMHRWTLANERALAQVRARDVAADDPTRVRFAHLLAKLIGYVREADQPGSGDFVAGQVVVRDLERLAAQWARLSSTRPWDAVATWAAANTHAETAELVNALLLELYPAIVEDFRDALDGPDRFELAPQMSLQALRELVLRDYAWALPARAEADADRYFWYRSVQAPRDLRRGLRGLAPELEAENAMETPHQVRALWRALEAAEASQNTVADLLVAQPALRYIVARVQTLAGSDYAELRTNWGSAALSPFPPVRFVLAFYGMEKFEAVHPKQVRGAFMQGAPIAEDIEAGLDVVDDPVSWPYPQIPRVTDYRAPRAPLPPRGLGALSVVDKARAAPRDDRPDDWIRLAPSELARMIQTALQGHGLALGIAEEAARFAMFAHERDPSRSRSVIDAVLRACTEDLPGALDRITVRTAARDPHSHCDAAGISALLVVPLMLDLACARAWTLPDGIGIATIEHARDLDLLDAIAWRAAERGLTATIADAGTPSSRYEFRVERIDAPSHDMRISAEFDAWHRDGLLVRRGEFDALNRALTRLWVPVEEEPRLRPDEGVDPLKVF